MPTTYAGPERREWSGLHTIGPLINDELLHTINPLGGASGEWGSVKLICGEWDLRPEVLPFWRLRMMRPADTNLRLKLCLWFLTKWFGSNSWKARRSTGCYAIRVDASDV